MFVILDDLADPLEAVHGTNRGSASDVFQAQGPEGGASLDRAVEDAANSNVANDPLVNFT